jgi:alkylation response protein AidB-like acyl-CoA dehydrogenase
MNFDLTEDQKMLVETVASFVKKQSPVSRARALREDARGFDAKVWRFFGEQGWIGVAFPEDVGGVGGSFVEAALVLEQLATALAPEPLLSALAAGAAILHAGDAAQKQKWLAPLVAGEKVLALAWAEAAGRYEPAYCSTRAERSGRGWTLHGQKRFVADGAGADALVLSARTEGGLSLFVVDAAACRARKFSTIDGRHAAIFELEGVEVGPESLLGGDGAGLPALERALDVGAAGAVAEGVGIARTVLAMTAEYLRTREQFGVKIGSFQALQHRAVDMFIETELLKSASMLASIEIDDADASKRRQAVSTAKVQLHHSGQYVVRQAIQLHGGIGITDEHDVGLYFKRMQALGALYGDEEHHVNRFAALPAFATF